MGNITSQQLDLHRFLGLTVCLSTTANPRRLEHYNYTYWTADFAALIVGGHLKHCLIAPQFPMYVSPKELALVPNASERTEADGDAEGVYVDIAIYMPVAQPRDLEDLGALAPQVAGKSLAHFFNEIIPQHLPGLSPRCVRVSGFEAPVLGELKPGPTHHAKGIKTFLSGLNLLLSEGTLQGRGSSTVSFLLGAICDTGRGPPARRGWGDTPGHQEMPRGSGSLLKMTAIGRREKRTRCMVTQSAKQRQKELNEQRTKRVKEQAKQRAKRATGRTEKRDMQHQKLLDALKTSPSVDRTTPLFTDAALNAVHRDETGDDLFESKAPETYFAGSGFMEWSRVLQLGSDLSNRYMAKIQDYIRTFEDREEKRKTEVFFTEEDE
ncbi:hypothetical protein C8F04DRAFT_1238293 [Mycena alexandri]|uniref:Uncharacterized protein n=1 Tax=Mycena alexandri TaxID=1745969 RepID=A0AAD6SHH7_9AGAR|nr:hypothetical protein C8F04DRAFT_1238293 [Mycena alexandri]